MWLYQAEVVSGGGCVRLRLCQAEVVSGRALVARRRGPPCAPLGCAPGRSLSRRCRSETASPSGGCTCGEHICGVGVSVVWVFSAE